MSAFNGTALPLLDPLIIFSLEKIHSESANFGAVAQLSILTWLRA